MSKKSFSDQGSFFEEQIEQEDFDLKFLNDQGKQQLNSIGRVFESNNLDCYLIVAGLVEEIKQKVNIYIEEKEFRKAIPVFSMKRNYNLIESFLIQESIFYDSKVFDCRSDKEAENNQKDFWRSYDIGIEKLEEKPYNIKSKYSMTRKNNLDFQISEQEDAFYNDLAENLEKGIYPEDYDALKFQETEQDFNYKVIDLTPQVELDTYTETLRILKQRQEENLKLQFLGEQERQRQMQEYRLKMSRLLGEDEESQRLQQFTYDYDGKIILVKVSEPENLLREKQDIYPTVQHKIQQRQLEDISESQEIINEKKLNLKMEETALDFEEQERRRKKGPPKPKIRQVNNGENKEVPIGWIPAPNLEKLKPGKGVKVIEKERVREGDNFEQKIQEGSDFQSQMLSLKQSNPKQKIKLTKNQYKKLIYGINNEDESEAMQSGVQVTEEDFGISLLERNRQKLLSLQLNESNQKSFLTYANKKDEQESGIISVHGNAQIIFDEIQNNQRQSSRGESFLSKYSQNKNSNKIKTNINDKYNLQIINNKIDHEAGNDVILPPIYSPKPQPFQVNYSIGKLAKMNRNAQSLTTLQKTPLGIERNKLPAPQIGRTIGHSILKGINPENLESFTDILDKMINQSMEQIQNNITYQSEQKSFNNLYTNNYAHKKNQFNLLNDKTNNSNQNKTSTPQNNKPFAKEIKQEILQKNNSAVFQKQNYVPNNKNQFSLKNIFQ